MNQNFVHKSVISHSGRFMAAYSGRPAALDYAVSAPATIQVAGRNKIALLVWVEV